MGPLPPGTILRSLPPAALAVILGACAYDTRLGSVNARYQEPGLPLHFGDAGDKTVLSFTATGNRQAPVEHRRVYRARVEGNVLFLSQDTSNHHPFADIEEDLRYERERFAAAASLAWQEEDFFVGLAAGAVPESPRAYHLGAFGGFSASAGKVDFSVGAGLFRNTMRKRVHFWEYSRYDILDSLLPGRQSEEREYHPDTLSRWTVDWEVRAACGLRFRAHRRWAPFAIAEWGRVRFWHSPETGRDFRLLQDITMGGGLEWRPRDDLPLRAELRAGKAVAGGEGPPVYLQGGIGASKEW